MLMKWPQYHAIVINGTISTERSTTFPCQKDAVTGSPSQRAQMDVSMNIVPIPQVKAEFTKKVCPSFP